MYLGTDTDTLKNISRYKYNYGIYNVSDPMFGLQTRNCGDNSKYLVKGLSY